MSRDGGRGSGAETARISREVKELAGADFSSSGVRATPVGGSLRTFRAELAGPSDSPYEGGLWALDVELPATYPFEAPKMRFVTPIWHPNVSSVTGAICLDILKSAWTPAMTIKTALLSVRALLAAPEPTDPQDAQVAKQYIASRSQFDATARFWRDAHASPASGSGAGPAAVGTNASEASASSSCAPAVADSVKKIAELVAMGFEESASKRALLANNGDLEAAMNSLLSA